MSLKKPPSELKLALDDLRPYFVRAGWFSLFSSLLILVPSWYMLEVYDRVVNSRSHMTLIMLTVFALFAFVIMELLEWSRSEMMHSAGLVLDKRLSKRVFAVVFQASLLRVPGATTQPMGDLRIVRDFLHSPVLLSSMEAPASFVFLALIFAINPLLGYFALVAAIVQVFVGWLNERSTQPPLIQANRTAFAAQQYADGTLRNAQVIESMGMVRDIHRLWMTKQQEFLRMQALASVRAGGYQAVSKLMQNLVGSVLLGLSAWLLLHNQLNGGGAMLIISGILGGRVLAPLVQLVTHWRGVVNVRESWQRLEQLLASVPAKAASMPLPAPKGFLQVENIVAGAPQTNAAPIIKGVAFAVSPGEVLVVVGPSASGKTTLARLLVGIWPVTGGKVRLDGADVYSWDKAELGPHIGYLPQGVELFDGTLAENIARFDTVDMFKVKAAATAVGLHEFILALPEGYDTAVGQDGAMLSGGQRQRVALARALYGDPVFVVLDEPNSSLDDVGDAALARAITELKTRGTTFVIMTHRPSVFAVADKMLVLREGQSVAFGPIAEVIAALQKANAEAQAQAQAPSPSQQLQHSLAPSRA